jgi:hypothetical protein
MEKPPVIYFTPAHIQKCMRAIHHMNNPYYNNYGAVPLFDSHNANRDPNTPYNTAYCMVQLHVGK